MLKLVKWKSDGKFYFVYFEIMVKRLLVLQEVTRAECFSMRTASAGGILRLAPK